MYSGNCNVSNQWNHSPDHKFANELLTAPGARANGRFLALLLVVISAGLLLLLHLYGPPAADLWANTFFDSSLDIHIRVHDQTHKLGDQPYKDRFGMTHELRPGVHMLRVPLEKILNAPQNRQMDLSRIDVIVIFFLPSDVGRSFQLADIRLE